jgi:hypothetical protein
MTDLASFRSTDAHGGGFQVEISDGQAGQLSIATARSQCTLNKRAEITRACVDDPPALIGTEISDDGGISFAKRFDFAPRVVRPSALASKCSIEVGLVVAGNSRFCKLPSWTSIRMFARAKSKRYFERIKSLLGVDDKAELVRLLEAINAQNGTPRWDMDCLNPGALLQVDLMATTP